MALISVLGDASLERLGQMNEELLKLNRELYERNTKIEQELYITRQLQQSLLPTFLDIPGYYGMARCHYLDETVRVTGVYMPCDSVGGDLYDVVQFKPSEPYLGLALADVSGHGVPASFITAMFKASLYRATHIHEHPGAVLHHVNNELMDMVKTGDYVTALYCRLIEAGNVLEYAGAGHPYPLLYRCEQNTIEMLQENGTPLVWMKEMEYNTGCVTLSQGDKVLAYTDGVSEIYNTQDEMLGDERLKQIFQDALTEPHVPILDVILQALSDFTQGEPLHDDLSMILIERF